MLRAAGQHLSGRDWICSSLYLQAWEGLLQGALDLNKSASAACGQDDGRPRHAVYLMAAAGRSCSYAYRMDHDVQKPM